MMNSADPFNPMRYVLEQLKRYAPPTKASSRYNARVKGRVLLLLYKKVNSLDSGKRRPYGERSTRNENKLG